MQNNFLKKFHGGNKYSVKVKCYIFNIKFIAIKVAVGNFSDCQENGDSISQKVISVNVIAGLNVKRVKSRGPHLQNMSEMEFNNHNYLFISA